LGRLARAQGRPEEGDRLAGEAAPQALVHTGAAGAPVQRFLVDTDARADGTWQPYAQPQDVRTLLDVKLGRLKLDRVRRGTYTLFETNGGQLSLQFSSLPDPQTGGPPHTRTLPVPAGATCLGVLADPEAGGCSTLFVGGEGIYVFEADAQGAMGAAASRIPDSSAPFTGLTALAIRQDRHHLSVWALDRSQRLTYTRGDQAAERAWTLPMVMQTQVAQMATIRSAKRSANELFVARADNTTIQRLWQDPASSLWTEGRLSLPALLSTREVACYTTVVRFTDADGNPIAGQPVRLNASSWTYATVNGFYMTLDADTAVDVATDGTGSVTIIQEVAALSAPIFRFQGDIIQGTLIADPTAAARQRILAMAQDGTLGQKVLPDGRTVAEAIDPSTLAVITEAFSQLGDVTDTLPPDGSAVDPDLADPDGADTPTVSAPATPQAAKKSTAPTMKMAVVEGGVVVSWIEDTAGAIMSLAGDILRGLKNVAQTAVGIAINAVEKVYEFAIQVGETLVKFVVETIEHVLALMDWLFSLIGAAIETLIQWIGFLFSWDDIKTTQQVFNNMAVQTARYIEAELRTADALVDPLGAWLKQQVDKLLGMDDATAAISLSDAVAQGTSGAPAEAQTAGDTATSSPGGSFSTYQVQHGGVTSGDPPDYDDTTIASTIGDFVRAVADAIEATAEDVAQMFKDLKQLWDDDQFTLGNVARVIAGGVADALIDAVCGVLHALIGVVTDVTAMLIDDVLLREINLPVISWLYEKFVSDGAPMTVMGACALIGAIPATLVYKVATGKSPWEGGTYGFDTASWQTLFPLVPEDKLMPSHTLMLAATSPDSVDASKSTRLYTQIGGMMAATADALNLILFPINATFDVVKKSRIVSLLNCLQAGCSMAKVAGSFAFDDDRVQQGLDRTHWLFDVADLALSGIAAIASVKDAWSRAPEGEAAPINGAAPLDGQGTAPLDGQAPGGEVEAPMSALEKIEAGGALFFGAIGLLFDVVSYFMEITSEDDNGEYHSAAWDTEKLASNLCAFGGTLGQGIFAFTKTPTPLIVGSVSGALAFIGNLVRSANDAINDNLYQSR
ncbi:MAG: hypothetical protein KC549_01975, partial [Myxococcales bacterium]|nr:hypothetical protein [Myxococcales bacterium]